MGDMAFCERLRMLRKQARLTQQDVADELRIHRTTYTRYETGAVAPDQQGLVQLAELFGVTVDYMLGRARDTESGLDDTTTGMVKLSLQEAQLVQMYRQLTYLEQQELQKKIIKAYQNSRKNRK